MKAPVALKHIDGLAESNLPCVLMLTHAMGGGVARHLVELIDSLQQHAHVLQLRPSITGRRLITLMLPGLEPGNDGVNLAFTWPEQKEYLWRFLAQLGVTQVHVHHVLNWPRGFWSDFAERSVAYDLTLHDHCIFSCASFKASNAEQKHWLERVQRCFSGDSVEAAEHLHMLLANARRVILPSVMLKEQLEQFVDSGSVFRLEHHPHPEAEKQYVYPAPWIRALSKVEPLRVLCLGMLSAEKGARVLAQVARETEKQFLPLEFHLLGSCHVSLPSNVCRHGSYKDDDVPELLKQIDPHVLWLPAQCPETWSYTLSAGLKAGLPVVATRLGVFPERLQQRPLSWLCDVDFSVSQWLGMLLEVRNQHLLRSEASVVWRYKTQAPFYTASRGYLLSSDEAACRESEPLADWQVVQCLVQGLPETRRWRESILYFLLKLKYTKIMTPLVRIIPYSWQRRIKRLLSRAPLHEPPL